MQGNILIVEDDSSILMGLKFCLETEGFIIDTVSLGSDAITKCETNSFDLVLDLSRN